MESDSTPSSPGPAPGKPLRVTHLAQYRDAGVPLTMLTSYDAISASIFDAAGIDLLLVGDSYGTTMLGMDSTVGVTLPEMVTVTRAVAGAVKRALVVADMPFGSYESSPAQAVDSAVELIRAGANMVKLEGGRRILPQIEAIVNAGIPVMGHLGFTPQSENALGGKRIQGRNGADKQLLSDAIALQTIGVSALVLEMVPAAAVAKVRESVTLPIIGIGAGPECDGQVLVWTDMVGATDWAPSFVHKFANLGQELHRAASDYAAAVRDRRFPGPENYHTD